MRLSAIEYTNDVIIAYKMALGESRHGAWLTYEVRVALRTTKKLKIIKKYIYKK